MAFWRYRRVFAAPGNGGVPEGRGRRADRAGRHARRVLAVVAVAVLLAVAPALPAAWAGLAALGAVGDNAGGQGGAVTVTHCARGPLLAGWQCRGTFAFSDPMAQGSAVTPDVLLANDYRYHPAGQPVGAALLAGTRRAYLWGGQYQASVLLLAAGVALCALAAAALAETRRTPISRAAGVLLVLGLCAVSPTLIGLWSRAAGG